MTFNYVLQFFCVGLIVSSISGMIYVWICYSWGVLTSIIDSMGGKRYIVILFTLMNYWSIIMPILLLLQGKEITNIKFTED